MSVYDRDDDRWMGENAWRLLHSPRDDKYDSFQRLVLGLDFSGVELRLKSKDITQDMARDAAYDLLFEISPKNIDETSRMLMFLIADNVHVYEFLLEIMNLISESEVGCIAIDAVHLILENIEITKPEEASILRLIEMFQVTVEEVK